MRILTILGLILALAPLGGCVIAPAPGYYRRPPPAYVAPRPYWRPYGYGYRGW